MRHIGDKLYWKSRPIEVVDDAELAVARDYTHRWFHHMMDTQPFSKSAMEYCDNVIAQLCAIEAECLRRGQQYRDPFEEHRAGKQAAG